MDEPRPKWQISIGQLLGATLGIAVALALIRLGLVVGPPIFILFGCLVIALTLGTVASTLAGRSPAVGLIWGIIAAGIAFAGWYFYEVNRQVF